MNKRFSVFLATILCLGMSGVIAGAETPEVNLYGHLVSSTSSDDVPGIYQFTNGSTAGFNKVAELPAEPNAGAVRVGSLYYVFNIANQGEFGGEYSMYIYDSEDNYTLVTRALASSSFMSEAQVIAYDPSTEKIFCTYNDAYDGNRLATLDVKRRTRDFVASLDYNKFLTLSFDSKGVLYGINNMGILYEIDKINGETRYIGSTGVLPAEFQQAATFVATDDKTLYWVECGATEGSLYAVDVTTAHATLIKTFAHEEEFAAIWVGSAVIQDDAPGMATQLEAEFINGALTGNFVFTAPQTTHSGHPLQGTLSYTVKIDGQEKVTGITRAGAQVRCFVTTTQGMHDFSVVMSNGAGNGGEATLKKQYVGNDTPGMVKNVQLASGDEKYRLILTWDTPESGTHGGYFNPDAVKYRVRRMPDDIIVSEQATSPFEESVKSDKPMRCFYDVIPYIDENTQGIAASSNKIMIGTPFSVPYSEDFSSNDNVTSFTVEDCNNDGTTWEYQYDFGYMRIWSNEKVKDDWLFTPFITLEQDAEYKLTFDVQSISSEKMEVMIGDDAISSNMEKLLLEEIGVTDVDWKTMECSFTVDETKPWFVGFHCTTTDYESALALYLDNIKIEKIGEAPSTGILDVDDYDTMFRIDGNTLTLVSSEGKNVAIYCLDGYAVFHGVLRAQQAVLLKGGIYVVVIDGKPYKVVVK